jgi:hypothetical protein
LPRQKLAILTLIAVLAPRLPCFAKTSTLAGKIVAYDLMQHASKQATDVQNQETVVLEATGSKHKYVKVVFSNFGMTQIEQKYFAGTEPLSVEVLREHSCDENSPRFVPQATLEKLGGTYLLTDPFKSSPPGKIKTLQCYVAIYRKKK